MKVSKKLFQQIQKSQTVQILSTQKAKAIKGGHKSEEDQEGCGACILDSELGS